MTETIAQEDDLKVTPLESFVPETDPVIAEASPHASPVSILVLELSTPQGSPAGMPILHLTDDEAIDKDPPQN